MAPFTVGPRFFTQGNPTLSSQIKQQWTNPSDILSLLLVVGGDVVQRALAQHTGGHGFIPPPVVFSFGWVAYGFCGLLAAVGDKSFLPTPELSAVVMSAEWGYARTNSSWIISRLLRDYEALWMPAEVKGKMQKVLQEAGHGRTRAGLCMAVFEASSQAIAGVPERDILWYSGYIIATLQFCIAIIPWVMANNWMVFAATAVGTILAFGTASLPHWTHERWACNKNSKKTFIITRGNGAQHAIVIIGNGRSLDFESLATSSEGTPNSRSTPYMYAGLAVMWCMLLITVSGIQEQTWYLLLIGAIGMAHTVVIAGASRRPGAYGIHLEFRDVFAKPKVMKTLQEVEAQYPGLGRSTLKIFFPGELYEEEKEWWQKARERELQLRQKRKLEADHIVDTGNKNYSVPSETSSSTNSYVDKTIGQDGELLCLKCQAPMHACI